jgi:hypothetical protein
MRCARGVVSDQVVSLMIGVAARVYIENGRIGYREEAA